MSTQLEPRRSEDSIVSAKRSPGEIILREQSKESVILIIAGAIDKTAALFQIPNWNTTASVDLAEWTYTAYQFEELDVIVKGILNPPPSDQRVYRLSPDVISEWMAVALDKKAEQREKEHQAEKKKPHAVKEIIDAYKPSPEELKQLEDAVSNSNMKAIPKLTPEEQKFWGGEKPKASSVNYRNPFTQEEIELKQAITKAGSEFYRKNKFIYTTLKLFNVNEFDVLADTQEHANEIFNNARQMVAPAQP